MCVALLLVGCASESGVPWGNYSPDVRARIDSMTAEGDCAGLQREFDTADANNTAQMNRTGRNNAKLMEYIYDRMRAAGCYG